MLNYIKLSVSTDSTRHIKIDFVFIKVIKMKYRSRTDIFASILQSANSNKGVGITTIMYKSFLSHYQLKKYLSIMLENELIKLEEEEHLYRITEKGLRFLQLFSNINELIDTTKEYNI
jgi:predicted transcriptional regulator